MIPRQEGREMILVEEKVRASDREKEKHSTLRFVGTNLGCGL